MVNIVVSFLEWLEPGYKALIGGKLYKSKALKRMKGFETKGRKLRRRNCLAFIRDEEQQKLFLGMPRHFLDAAQDRISRFDKLGRADGNGVSKDQHLALDLAIIAALTAIITSFPLRLKTMMELAIGGSTPNVIFPKTQGSENDIILNITADIMKNNRPADGVPLSPSATVNPREILTWYIEEAHPLVLRYKVKFERDRNPELLFGGLNQETVRNIWNRRTQELGMDYTIHMARHLLASLLYHHGVRIEEIAELLCDSVNVTQKNYTFVDRLKKIQSAMDAKAHIYSELGL